MCSLIWITFSELSFIVSYFGILLSIYNTVILLLSNVIQEKEGREEREGWEGTSLSRLTEHLSKKNHPINIYCNIKIWKTELTSSEQYCYQSISAYPPTFFFMEIHKIISIFGELFKILHFPLLQYMMKKDI